MAKVITSTPSNTAWAMAAGTVDWLKLMTERIARIGKIVTSGAEPVIAPGPLVWP